MACIAVSIAVALLAEPGTETVETHNEHSGAIEVRYSGGAAGGPGSGSAETETGGRADKRLTLLFNGVAAWPDLEGSRLVRVPAGQEGMMVVLPRWQYPVGSEVTYTCPAGLSQDCEAWVFHFECVRTCTAKYQVGLVTALRMQGWTRRECAPHFEVEDGEFPVQHEMKALFKRVAPGTSVTLTVPTPASGVGAAEFVFFGLTTTHASTLCTPGVRFGPPAPCFGCPWETLAMRPVDEGPFFGGLGGGPQ